jgi:hypothetical protein
MLLSACCHVALQVTRLYHTHHLSACAFVISNRPGAHVCPSCYQMDPCTLSVEIISTAAEYFLVLNVVSHVQLAPHFVHCHSFDSIDLVQAAKFSGERQILLATINRLTAGGPAQNAGASFSHHQGTAALLHKQLARAVT